MPAHNGEHVKFVGRLVDMGDLDHGTGLTVEHQESGQLLTLTGMTREQVREIRGLFGETVRITVEAAR
jgi:hypothetical protein